MTAASEEVMVHSMHQIVMADMVVLMVKTWYLLIRAQNSTGNARENPIVGDLMLP